MKSLLLFALFASEITFASTTDVWEGSGILFNEKVEQIGSYTLVVENTKTSRQIQSYVAVSLPDGKIIKQQCLMTESKEGTWNSKCDHGAGGGQCFGNGLCMSYEKDSKGKAYATTIIKDGNSDMRLLRTELQDGKPVHFFREKLHKR